MLRITPYVAGGEYRIKLEGALDGPWVAELGACWLDAASAQPGRRIRIELADVCHVDRHGRELMTLMYRTGVRFIARGFVMPDVVREITEAVDGGSGRKPAACEPEEPKEPKEPQEPQEPQEPKDPKDPQEPAARKRRN